MVLRWTLWSLSGQIRKLPEKYQVLKFLPLWISGINYISVNRMKNHKQDRNENCFEYQFFYPISQSTSKQIIQTSSSKTSLPRNSINLLHRPWINSEEGRFFKWSKDSIKPSVSKSFKSPSGWFAFLLVFTASVNPSV